jgi:HK97 family phage portal protein
MKQAMVAYLELTGTAYIEKLYSAKDSSTLAGLWPLIDPRKMMVIAGEKQLIDGYVYTGPKGMVVFKPEDMIFMRTFAPDNPFYGYSPTQVLRVTIGGDLKALNWNWLFFENGARPDGMLVSQQRLSSSDIDLILDTWDDSHQGEQGWHRPAVMGQGMTWEDVGAGHKDMDFPNLRRYSKEEILGAYGVPPIVAGDYKDANRASSDVMYKLYFEGCILPRCDLIEDALNMALLDPGSGLRLVFDLGSIEALKGDLLNLAKVGARIRSQGWSTNEMRYLIWNLPVIEDNPDANAVWDPAEKVIIGHAPVPTELTQRTSTRSGG